MNRIKLVKYIHANDAIYARLTLDDFSDEHLFIIFTRLAADKRLAKLRKSMKEKYPELRF